MLFSEQRSSFGDLNVSLVLAQVMHVLQNFHIVVFFFLRMTSRLNHTAAPWRESAECQRWLSNNI